MNLGQNKFILGFGVVMLIGCGTLGFLVSQSAGKFSELSDQYEQQLVQLKTLQSKPVYPDQENLQKLLEQKDQAVHASDALAQQLGAIALPLQPITPEQFQEKLRTSVAAILEKANSLGVKVSDKFYLGFGEYQTRLPKAEAASVLDRQLRAIDLAVNTLIDNKVSAIADIKRDLLPEEQDASKTQPGKPVSQAPASPGAGKAALVSKYPFEIQFSADQARFRRAVNELTRNDKQFMIVRPVSIKNELDKPLMKIDPFASAATEQPATPGEPAAPKEQALHYLVGTEKLAVNLRVEMVIFGAATGK